MYFDEQSSQSAKNKTKCSALLHTKHPTWDLLSSVVCNQRIHEKKTFFQEKGKELIFKCVVF